MTHPNPTTLPSPQVQVRNERTAAMVPCRAPMWTDIVSDAGAGSLILQVADEATVQDGDMLTGIVHGEESFSWTAQRTIRRTLDPDPSARTVQVSGAGLLGEWAEWVVTPPNPIGDAPEGVEVRYDWTTADISTWDAATQRSVVGDRTALPPNGLAGLTDDMPNPLAYWVAPRAAVPASADPVGVFYVGMDFTLDEDTFYVPYWLADDLVASALDGVLFSQFVDRENMASHTRARLVPLLKAGNHRWRWKVENVARDHPQNCGLFAFAAAARYFSATSVAILEDWLHTSCVADGFKTLDYGEPEPGRTVGFIVGDQHDKVPAYLSLADWSLDFSATLDSAGNAWPVVQQRFRAGLTLLGMLRQIAASGHAEFRPVPGERTLQAFAPGSAPIGPDLDWHDLRDLEHDVDRSSITSQILVRDDTGRMRWFGTADGPAAFAEIGGVEGDAIEAVAEAQLDRLNEAATSVTFTHLPADPADGIYHAYRPLDVIGVPNQALDGHDDHQVRQITMRVDDLGRAQPSVTVASRRRLLQERQEVAARRQTPGVKSDAVAPASPLQPQEVVLERFTQTWSWSGRAADASGLMATGQRFEPTRPCRIHHIKLSANEVKDTSDPTAIATTVTMHSMGVPFGLGLGVVTLGTTDEMVEEDLIYLVQPGEIIQPVITSGGTHVMGKVEITGAYLPQ